MLYSDDLFLMSEPIEGLRDKFWIQKEDLRSNSVKVSKWNTEVFVTRGVAKDGLTFLCCPLLDPQLEIKRITQLCVGNM